MNLRTLSFPELVKAAEYSEDFDYMQAARREIVQRAIHSSVPIHERPDLTEDDMYQIGYKDGYDEAKEKYAL